MKNRMSILIIVIMLVTFTGCQKTLRGTEELIEKAREEFDVNNVEVKYVGLCSEDNAALLWFIAGNDYQERMYLPMECDIAGKEEYTYVHKYTPLERSEDIAVLYWKDGICFLVNNTNCSTIKITDASGVREIAIEEEYPYIFYYKPIPEEFQYQFLDSDSSVLYMK